jgi:hypothetical protein
MFLLRSVIVLTYAGQVSALWYPFAAQIRNKGITPASLTV